MICLEVKDHAIKTKKEKEKNDKKSHTKSNSIAENLVMFWDVSRKGVNIEKLYLHLAVRREVRRWLLSGSQIPAIEYCASTLDA